MDDTIVPVSYRTGKGDRGIPLTISVVFALAIPVFWWALGPYGWPWGAWVSVALALVSGAALVRWWLARVTVVWQGDTLEFCRGTQKRLLDLDSLDRIIVNPALARTLLRSHGQKVSFSHRLVRVDRLHDALAARRPELFPPVEGRLRLATSWSVYAVLGGLALGTVVAGLVLAPWNAAVGIAFEAAGAAVLARALWAVPRAFVIEPGRVTVGYWLRRRTLRRVWVLGQDSYTAGGVVFHRIHLAAGRRPLILDEGSLSRPLRPHFVWIVGQLGVTASH